MDKLKQLIKQSKQIVLFSGAGFSTESGIPDFRSVDSKLQKVKYCAPVEVMLSHSFFVKHTKLFYEFYFHEMIHAKAKPNRAHEAIAKLEKLGKMGAIITQNIDGLHFEAGNQKVIELHGSIHRNYCMKCNKGYTLEQIINNGDIPLCECGGVIKPDVALYEEVLNKKALDKAINAIQNADLLIVAGTSLTVYPAAGLLQYYKGKEVVLINKEDTNFDKQATLLYRNNISFVLDCINTL